MRLPATPTALLALALLLPVPAVAQFYKDKTLTLLINYGPGGNADLEARVFQQHLRRFIPGAPTIIVQNQPGAGGVNAMNMLGLNVGSKPDGLTLGYFTFSPTPAIADDPSLKVNLGDFVVVGATRSWAVAYARKDTPPGLTRPADIVKAPKVFIGGYSRATLHDTRLRLSFELLNVPYTMVTGFQATAGLNKAMLQNEVNVTASTLPAYQTQAIPQLIGPGVALPLWQFPILGPGDRPAGNPALERQGIAGFEAVLAEATGKPAAGPKFEAMVLINHLGTQMQRLIVLPKGSPMEAATALRAAFQEVARDPAFRNDFHNVTKEEPEIARADEVEPLLKRIASVDPAIKQVVKASVSERPGDK